jgi:hypothetical protein
LPARHVFSRSGNRPRMMAPNVFAAACGVQSKKVSIFVHATPLQHSGRADFAETNAAGC